MPISNRQSSSPSSSAITVVNEGALADTGERSLMDFVDPRAYAQAFEFADWSLTDEILELTKIARQSDHLSSKLVAIKLLHQNAVEALILSGRVSRVRATEHRGGRTITVTQVRSALDGANSDERSFPMTSQKELPHDQTTEEIIDAGDASTPALLDSPERPLDGLSDHLHLPPSEDLGGVRLPSGDDAFGEP